MTMTNEDVVWRWREPRVVYAWEGEVDGLRAEITRLTERIGVLESALDRESLARILFEANNPGALWDDEKGIAAFHNLTWPTFTASRYYERADKIRSALSVQVQAGAPFSIHKKPQGGE